MGKIKKYYPEAKLILRITADETASVMKFNKKFGVGQKNFGTIIGKCREFNLDLVGVSFHVGSKANNSTQYINSIMSCKQVFEIANEIQPEASFSSIPIPWQNRITRRRGVGGSSRNKGREWLFFGVWWEGEFAGSAIVIRYTSTS